MTNKVYCRRVNVLLYMVIIMMTTSTPVLMGCAVDKEWYKIDVIPPSLYFGSDKETIQSVIVSTGGEWYVHMVSPFIDVNPHSGSGNSTLLVRMAEKNEDSEIRYGFIVLQSVDEPEYTATIQIKQDPDEKKQ